MIPGSAVPLLLAKSDDDYKIDRSLRFNSADSAYLNRTPSSASNRKTWTWSGWVKLCKNKGQVLFHSYSAQNDSGAFFIDYLSSGSLRVLGWSTGWRYTSQLFRDFSAWQHVVVAVDTTNATANDRIKIYVNGTQITQFDTFNNPSQDAELAINQAALHRIGNYTSGSNNHDYFDGYLADVHFIDGQALAATDFGEPNADTGIWQPKEFAGSYASTYTSTTLSQTGWAPASENNIWDGSTSTLSNGYNGGIIGTVSFSPPLTNVTKVEVYQQNYRHYLNGSQVTTSESGTTWHTLYDNSSSPITLNSVGNSYSNNTQTVDIAAIRINGYVVNSKTWTPPSGVGVQTVGPNSFYLKFADNSSNAALGTDSSGNNNTFTVNNLTAAASGATSFSSTNVTSASNILDGNTGSAATFTSTNAVFDAVCNISGITNLEFMLYGGTSGVGQMQYRVNGSSYTNAAFPNDNSYPWNNATSLLTNGTLTSFGFKLSGAANGGARAARYTTSAGTFYITSTPGYEVDGLIDTPTNYEASPNNAGNYCTLNPLYGELTLSNGNLDATAPSEWKGSAGTIGMTSGKFYWEIDNVTGNELIVGIIKAGIPTITWNTTYGYNSEVGYFYPASGGSPYGATWAAGDVIGIAFDADIGSLTFYKNGVSQGVAITGLTDGPYLPSVVINGSSRSCSVNFGQRAFTYTNAGTNRPAATYLSLCTTNLPEPTIADGSTAFDTKLWTGNGGTQTISGLNLSPDFAWIKQRNTTRDNVLLDSVRGANEVLYSNATSAEATYTNTLNSFDSNGFTLGGNQLTNENNGSYVGWVWDAGTSNTTIAAGGLNSSVYNQSHAITSNITSSGSLGGTLANWFNGQRANKLEPSGSGSLDFTSVSALQNFSGTLQFAVSAYSGSTSMKFVINASTDNLTFTTNTLPSSSGGFPSQLLTIPVTSLRTLDFTSVSGQSTQFWGMYLNGKLLVDSTATPDTVPLMASTVRANPTAGISIVSYTGSSSAVTVAHGLNAAPEMIIVKDRDSGSYNWQVAHIGIGADESLILNANNAKADYNAWNNTRPTSTVFSLGAGTLGVNTPGNNMIAYCFAPVEGLSSVGSFVGNGSADGPFVYTGFKVKWLLVRRSDATQNWVITDGVRNTGNVVNKGLYADLTNSENTFDRFDFVSNGFKVRNNLGEINASGGTYIYLAFAEHPFKTARAR